MMKTIAQVVYNAADSMSFAMVEVYGEECLGPRTFLIVVLILSRRPAMETVIRMFKLTDTDQYAVPILTVIFRFFSLPLIRCTRIPKQ